MTYTLMPGQSYLKLLVVVESESGRLVVHQLLLTLMHRGPTKLEINKRQNIEVSMAPQDQQVDRRKASTYRRCVIECSDYRKFMRSLAPGSVDLVLTDPPYNISRKTGFANCGKKSVDRFAVSMDFGQWDHQPINLQAFAKECFQILRPGGTAIVWYDVWKITPLTEAMVQFGFKMLRLIVWNKTNPVPLNSKSCYLTNSREVAVLGVKGGKPTFNSVYDSGNYHYPIPRHKGRKIHPTQKSIDLFNDLVVKHTKQGDLVVDPFLGSGTTAVAAIKNNRIFAGCDIDPYYSKLAQERLSL